MKFPELCARLIKEVGAAKVYCAKYPKLGTIGGPLVLYIKDGVFDVGGTDPDRGGWYSSGIFATETAACEFIYKKLTRVPPKPAARTPEEKERSRKLNEELIRSILGETPEN